MFRGAHPLEVALLFTVTGILFGVWFFVKFVSPPGSLGKQLKPNILEQQLYGMGTDEIVIKEETPESREIGRVNSPS